MVDIYTALIIEPNISLQTPYSYIPESSIHRCENIQLGRKQLARSSPKLVFLSTSFSLPQTIEFLDALKHASAEGLIPIILVVDHSHKISHLPGTTWGDKIGILSSLSSEEEFNSTVRRVMTS